MYQLDLSVLYFFNRTITSPAMDTAFDILTNVHYWYYVYAIAGLFLIYRYKWRGVSILVATLLLVAATDSLGHYIIKPLVGRVRPCGLLPDGSHVVPWIRLPVGMRGDPSFASQHALNNFAVAAFFWAIWPHKDHVSWLFGVAFLISIGRIYEGVHYPSDVLGGAAIGIAIGVGAGMLFLLLNKKKPEPNARPGF